MFETIKTARISEQIAAQVRQLLLEGKLQPGQKLPTEHELAGQFAVSRPSVREALSILESEGLVDRRKNGGTYVRHYSLKRLLGSLDFPRKLDDELFVDLLEAREYLELQIVQLGAERAGEPDWLRLELTLSMMAEDLAAGRSGVESDVLFHQCLAVATKNQILAGLVHSIEQMMTATRAQTLSVPGRLAVCLEEHRSIYEAVRGRRADEGCRLMRQHLARVREIIHAYRFTATGEDAQ